MAWTVKLQSGNGGVTGYNEFELVYDAASQANYKLQYNSQIGGQDADVLYHTPDNGSPIPKRLTDKNALIFLTMDVTGDDWDDIINRIDKIKRIVSGAESQAARYSTGGNANRVRVKIQPDGATMATYYDVLHGFVDTTKAYYAPEATINTLARQVVVGLTCKPGGYGDAITLRNDLASSPHFIEDSDADGLADGWSTVNSPTATTIELNNWLVGGQCQRVDGDAAEGIQSDSVTATTPDIVAYAWIRAFNGSARFRVGDSTGNVVTKILTTTDSNNVSDKSITSRAGTTWYRVSYSGTLTGNNPFIQILANEAGSNILVDAAYLQIGTLDIPDGWCSSSSLKNRYDPDVAEGNINYLDVLGVPGDMPAIANTTITIPAVSRGTIIGSRYADGNTRSSAIPHWIEDDEFTSPTLGVTGTWSTVTDAARSGGSYRRYTETTSGPYNPGNLSVSISGSEARALLLSQRRVFAVARASTTGTTFKLLASIAGLSVGDDTKTGVGDSPTTANTWELIDLGMINAKGLLPETVPSDSDQEITLSIDIGGTTASSTADIDALLLFMTEDEFVVWRGVEDTKAAGGDIVFSGEYQAVISEGSAVYETPMGNLWHLAPCISNRILLAIAGSDDSHVLTDTMSCSIDVIPRTSHLLGTL